MRFAQSTSLVYCAIGQCIKLSKHKSSLREQSFLQLDIYALGRVNKDVEIECISISTTFYNKTTAD
jgi:hypothetical protein